MKTIKLFCIINIFNTLKLIMVSTYISKQPDIVIILISYSINILFNFSRFKINEVTFL